MTVTTTPWPSRCSLFLRLNSFATCIPRYLTPIIVCLVIWIFYSFRLPQGDVATALSGIYLYHYQTLLRGTFQFHAILVWLGTVCFGIYPLHLPLLELFNNTNFGSFGPLMALGFTLIGGSFSRLTIEKPMILFAKKLAAKF